MSPGRRAALLAIGGVVAAGLAGRALWQRRTVGPELVDHPDLPGFRVPAGTGLAGAPGGALVGIRAPDGARGPLGFEAACAALFDDPADPVVGSGPVPVAYFTDYRCPYCRVLSGLLLARAEAGAIRLVVKEWAILGAGSRRAARVALAAHGAGAFVAVHERLMRSPFLPTEAYIAAMAEDLGLEATALIAAAEAPATDAALERVAGLASRFGFRGTPGLVVGRIVTEGALDGRRLDALVGADDGACGGPAPGP